MRKTAITLCITGLCFGTSAIANSSDRFAYFAANTGIFQGDFNNSFLDQSDLIPQNIVQPANQHSYTFGAAVGYRQLMNPRYFLGAELSANREGQYASFQSGASTAAFSDQNQIQYHIDLTFVPGIQLTSSIETYLKLGVSRASLQDNLTSPTGTILPVMQNFHSGKNVTGFAAGLGISKLLNEHVSVFTEANYHDYGTVSLQSFQNFTATYTHSAHIYSYDFVVGAAYKLDV